MSEKSALYFDHQSGRLVNFAGEELPVGFGSDLPVGMGGEQDLYLSGDPSLEFGGVSEMGLAGLDKIDNISKQFSFSLKNKSSDNAATVYLSPGLVVNRQGTVRDGDFTAIETGITVTGTALGNPIADFVNYCHRHSMLIMAVKLSTSSEAYKSNLSVPINVRKENPFEVLGSRPIHMGNGMTQNVQNTFFNRVLTPGLILGEDHLVTFRLLPSAEVTVEFFVGVVENKTTALKKKTDKAFGKIVRKFGSKL